MPDPYPERVLQFGTGVFLLGFADWIIEQLNRQTDLAAGVVALKARPGNSDSLAPLNRGSFRVHLRGYSGDELVDRVDTVHCLQRALNPFEDYAEAVRIACSETLEFVVSNTTEAGIIYRQQPLPEQVTPTTFPGMLTALLYQRFRHFDGAPGRGLAILCCELIEHNGDTLRGIVQRHAGDWDYPGAFRDWLDTDNAFCNTLVDRIVTGARTDAQGLLIEAETFHTWHIQAPEWVRARLPVAGTGLDVSFVDELGPYRERKVRILNGAHTGCFALSLLLDVSSVYASAQHPLLGRYLEQLVYREICPTLPGEDTRAYAAAILQRFHNPHIEHRWQSIALNALSKWRTRLLPTLLDSWRARGELPPLLVLSLAATLAFYRGQWQGRALPVQDDAGVLDAVGVAWCHGGSTLQAVERLLASAAVWGEPFPDLPGLPAAVAAALDAMEQRGLEAVVAASLGLDYGRGG